MFALRPLALRVRSVSKEVTGVQMAYADMVRRDPAAADVTGFYQERRDRFRSLVAGSRFRTLPCSGTYFQLLDYSAITDERDEAFAVRLTREYGVAAIPVSPFLQADEPAGPVLRFCFAKRDETLHQGAERLRNFKKGTFTFS